MPCVAIDPSILICRVNVVDLTPKAVADKEDWEFWVAPSERERVLRLLQSKSGTQFEPSEQKKRKEKPSKRIVPNESQTSEKINSMVFHSPQVSVGMIKHYKLTMHIMKTDLAGQYFDRKGILLRAVSTAAVPSSKYWPYTIFVAAVASCDPPAALECV